MQLYKLYQEAGENDLVHIQTYSGRGMYGQQCLGIVGSETDCMEFLTEITLYLIQNYEQNPDEIENTIRKVLKFDRDQMGRQIVLYWKNEPTDQREGEMK